MTLDEWLSGQRSMTDAMARASVRDTNLKLLSDRLDQGYQPVLASLHPEGFGPWPGPCWHIHLSDGASRESITIWPGFETFELFAKRMGEVPVEPFVPRPVEPTRDAVVSDPLPRELKLLIQDTSARPLEERAAALMDWIMEKIEAARCALVPFTEGSAEPPLAFHTRGAHAGSANLRHIPRQILEHVARTRQPLISHNVSDPANVLEPQATVLHQKVASYMAVPVVFRGVLLAVCYVDRFNRPRRFSPEEQQSFEAFAYELAMPLLSLIDERRRSEYRELRDAILDGEVEQRVEAAASPAWATMIERVQRIAPHSDENILLLGETGAGKEYVARLIHGEEGAKSPFVPVNLSAIPSELFEAELMGSAKGAFTGAVDRTGYVRRADGGTLFLDEIGDLSLANQVKLLRFLQFKTVTPLGDRERRVAVRVIAATNRPLRSMLTSGEFRQDLFHRFAPPLTVPPLRQRRTEIRNLAQLFLARAARRKGLASPSLDDAAMAFLESHSWPGNVRQLEAVLSHALLLTDGNAIDRVLLASLTGESDAESVAMDPGSVAVDGSIRAEVDAECWAEHRSRQADSERRWLIRVLAKHDDSVAAAARALGCPTTTLRSALQRHELLR